MIFFIETLWALIQLPKQPFLGFILLGSCHRVRVVLIVDDKCTLSNSDRPDARATVFAAIDIFESPKVHLLFFQNAIIAEIASGLLLVKLVLEDMDLVG